MDSKRLKFKYSEIFLKEVLFKKCARKYIFLYILTDDLIQNKINLQRDLLVYGIEGKFVKTKYLLKYLKGLEVDNNILNSFFGEVFACSYINTDNKFFTSLSKKSQKKNILCPSLVINNEGIVFYSSFTPCLGKLDLKSMGHNLIYKLLLVFKRLNSVLSYKK